MEMDEFDLDIRVSAAGAMTDGEAIVTLSCNPPSCFASGCGTCEEPTCYPASCDCTRTCATEDTCRGATCRCE
jgi:hypothetical protein